MSSIPNLSSRPADAAAFLPELRDLPLPELSVRALHGDAEIQSVLHLRKEINLSATAASAGFDALEKKETNWDSSAFLNFTGKSSAPFVPSPCNMA